MEWAFWAREAKSGEAIVVGSDVSTVVSNVALKGKGAASVFVNGHLLCVLNAKKPNARLRQVLPYDQATTFKVEGSSATFTGYTVEAPFDKLLEQGAQVDCCASGVCKSKKAEKTAAKAPPAADQQAAPVVQQQPPTLKSLPNGKAKGKGKAAQKAAPVDDDDEGPVDISDMALDGLLKQDDEENYDCGELVINGEAYFVDYGNWKLFKGPMDDAVFCGYWDQENRVITQKPPTHSAVPDELKLMQKQVEFAQQALKMKRAEWEADHGDESDATIDSDEEETHKTKSDFHKKRKTEVDKKSQISHA
ncbi:hypothetical protein DIPPA_14623 [Diplonema papillatum]|nr:hypothetical protein DIPPA_14623 [Diplonema papillatum]